jgi:hypothetical protein
MTAIEGFKRVVATNGTQELRSATVTESGFADVKLAPDPTNRHLSPSESIKSDSIT